jgi:hypothetical protein
MVVAGAWNCVRRSWSREIWQPTAEKPAADEPNDITIL